LFNSACFTPSPQQIPKDDHGGRLKRRRWMVVAVILAIALATSVGFSIYQSYNASNDLAGTVLPDGSMSFTFLWGPEAQHYVNGTFRIDVIVSFETLTWDNASAETVNIVVKVHDDDYSADAYLGLTLDMNHNGKIDFGPADNPCLMFADNTTIAGTFLTEEGFLIWSEMPIEPLHSCTYYPDEGYSFGPCRFALGEVMSKFGSFPAYIPIHVCFGRGVSFEFWVYPSRDTIPDIPQYTVQIITVNATFVGEPITVEGRIDPPISFKDVQIDVKGPSIWVGDIAITNPVDGRFAKSFYPEEAGTYEIWARLNTSTSNTFQIDIPEGD